MSGGPEVHSPEGGLDAGLQELGIRVPTTALARASRELLAAEAPPYLVNHSVRSYAFAVLLANAAGQSYDAEICYVASLLHDVGLLPRFDRGNCFEVDGATAGLDLARRLGLDAASAAPIGRAIAWHMAAIEPMDPPEASLLWWSTGVDVYGDRLDEVPPPTLVELLIRYPRLDFKRRFARAITQEANRKPDCRASTKLAEGMLDRIAAAPFSE
jgi:hypothetical protein